LEDARTIIALEWNGEVDIQRLEEIVRIFRETEGIKQGVVVDVLLTDDPAIAELNERYRGVEGPTDVLAFETAPPEACKPDVWALGQVVISCDRAADQARYAHIEFGDELAELLVHGLLHLVGYNHDGEESASAMDERSNLILTKVFDVYEE
jgi:probable rRNA maturation factor